MDQPSRQRARGIRTIGRLSMPQTDDVLLAQWPMPADPGHQHQDVAISNEWRRSSQALIPSSRYAQTAGELADFEHLVTQYEDHQNRVIHRLVETIAAELESGDSLCPAYEPPTIPLESVIAAVDQAVKAGDLSSAAADPIRVRALFLGESVARLWALVDLHRNGHITRSELRQKRDLVVGRPR
ncbi:hypothetical protein BH20CHL4_BH20CHL4_14350 [soil metagenome]